MSMSQTVIITEFKLSDRNGTYITQFGNTGALHERIEDPVGICIAFPRGRIRS